MKCKTKDCNAHALRNDTRCYHHSKIIPEVEKTEARSRGGKNKIIKVNGKYHKYELNSVSNVMKLNSDLINGVLSNEIDLRIATGLGYLLNIQAKAIEVSDIEKRLDALEQQEMQPTKITVTLPKSFDA